MEKKSGIGRIILLIFASGAAGAALRTIELLFAFEKDTGLAVPFHPASLALQAFTVIVLLAAAFFASRLAVFKPQDYHRAFMFRSPAMGAAASVSSLLLIAGSFFSIQPLLLAARPPEIALNLVRAALAVFTAVSIIMLSRSLSRPEATSAYMIYELVPVFWACFWLITTFMARASNPVVLDYAYELFAIITLLMFLYYAAGFTFSGASPKKTVFFALAAIYFSMTQTFGTLAGLLLNKNSFELSAAGDLSAHLFAVIYASVMVWSLLSNLQPKKLGIESE